MHERYRDNIITGLILGLLSVGIGYFILSLAGYLFIRNDIYTPFLNKPGMQLILLAVNLVIFRFLIVKWKLQETGRGFLLAIIISVIYFLFIAKHYFVHL